MMRAAPGVEVIGRHGHHADPALAGVQQDAHDRDVNLSRDVTMSAMTKRERVAAALRGEPADRPAWSLWRHFYAAESTADQLAERMLAWIGQYPFDFPNIPTLYSREGRSVAAGGQGDRYA